MSNPVKYLAEGLSFAPIAIMRNAKNKIKEKSSRVIKGIQSTLALSPKSGPSTSKLVSISASELASVQDGGGPSEDIRNVDQIAPGSSFFLSSKGRGLIKDSASSIADPNVVLLPPATFSLSSPGSLNSNIDQGESEVRNNIQVYLS